MIDAFGYLAVLTGLYAVSKKRMFPFRIWHIISCLCYIIYGVLNPAYPILVSGTLFIAIHLYKIKSYTNRNQFSRPKSNSIE